MIVLAEYDDRRPGTRYDQQRQKYVGYKIDVRVGGKRFRQAGFHTRRQAEEFVENLRLRNKYKNAGLPVAQIVPTVAQLFEARLNEITDHSEKIRAKRIFRVFQNVIPHGALVTDIRTVHFRLFIKARKGVKPETINREINPISKAFSSAADLFPEALEDFTPPKAARPDFKRKRREKIVTEKEKDAIVAHLGGDASQIKIGRMFELAWFLGMAYKEVAYLKKSAYNGTSLTFIRAKTGNSVTFEYLPDAVHKILSDAIADSKTEFVFSTPTTKDFYKILRKAIEDAGLVYGRDSGVTFHSARHSFVTHAMQHADLKTVGSMSGHSDDTMVLLYSHASPESRKRALQSMYGKKDLKDIFEKVKSGEMDYEDFVRAVE